MASYSVPTQAPQVIDLGTRMDQGLITFGSELKITQITEPVFKSALQAFIAANDGFNAARSARQAASDLFKGADADLTGYLQTAKNVLAGSFGNRWSTQWAQAGFINATTMIPTRIDGRLTLALCLSSFFTANPGYEVASLDVTAAEAIALRDAAVATQKDLGTATIAQKDAGIDYDTATP